MAQSLIQPSFAGGELAPALAARVDLAKYHVGAKCMRNFFVQISGGAANRPGTRFVGRVKDSSHPVRLIPFQFSTLQTYVLEFGHLYMRVVMDGGHVLEPSFAVTAVTNADPVVVSAPGHDFANGDEVFVTGTGITQVDGNCFLVAAAAAGSFQLNTLDNAALDGIGFGACATGSVARVYTLTTPYAGADLALLKYTQSADVLTLTHTGYGPMDLSRTQHWVWTLTTITFQPSVQPPASSSAGISSSAGNINYAYVVTAQTDVPVAESLPSGIATCVGAELNQDTGIQGVISWAAVTGATSYNVYKANPVGGSPVLAGAMMGYIGNTTGTSLSDTNIAPDFSQTPPQGQNPFTGGNNPGCVSYFQQRKVFGGSSSAPETLWMTQTGNYASMDVSSPSRADDAITATIATYQVNSIKHLVSVNALLALTASGAFQVSGGGTAAALTPTQTVVTSQAYTGCNDVPPLVINYDILYVQSKGSTVRDLSYNFYVQIYTGSDITVMSTHLFFGYQILDWCWAEEPFKLVWAVRNDGVLLCMTYLKEQDIYAWSHHDTLGQFTATASIPEGNEDGVYFVVTRTIPGVAGGQAVQYVERLASRNFLTNGSPDVTQGWFVDCGLKYQGTPTTTVSGLGHLEGAEVSILADGNVQPQQVVGGGKITVQHPASTIIVGLPYTADLATLAIDAGEPTVQGKRKKVSAVTLRLENSRGLKVGPDSATLVEVKERGDQPYGQAIPLTTGDQRVLLPPSWNTQGSVWIRQDNPLPATILGVIPEVRVGDAPG